MGSTAERKRIHLVSWNRLTKPKELGGLNLKAAKEMNWVLLAKLAWRILCSEGDLWAEVIKSEYKVTKEDGVYFKQRQRVSQIWRGILLGAELLRQGFHWNVRNGRRVYFWRDVWLGSRPLSGRAIGGIDATSMEKRVADYWDQELGWKWSELQFKLSASDLVMVASKVFLHG